MINLGVRVAKLEAQSSGPEGGPSIIIIRGFCRPGIHGPEHTGDAHAYIIGIPGTIAKRSGENDECFSLRLKALQSLGRHPDDCTEEEIQSAILEVKNNKQPLEASK